jgi:hypothetical protein
MISIQVEKKGVIIDNSIFKNKTDGNNINGPSFIKVPEFVSNPLGKYYMYFGHHRGKYIRMAYSEEHIMGPYFLYNEGKGVLSLENTPGHDHISSPDVVIDEQNKRFTLYYHCPYKNTNGKSPQSTFIAHSKDGLHFESTNINISFPYFRRFEYKHEIYGIALNNFVGSIIYKYINGVFVEYGELLPKSRHSCALTYNEKLYVFYSIVGDCPEHICVCEIDIVEQNNILVKKNRTLVYPEFEFEHANLTSIPSKYGAEYEKINQLRDPCVYVENDQFYLFYTVCGEKGIALCNIQFHTETETESGTS